MKNEKLVKLEMKNVKGGFAPVIDITESDDGKKGLDNSIIGCHAGEPGVFVTKCGCVKPDDPTK